MTNPPPRRGARGAGCKVGMEIGRCYERVWPACPRGARDRTFPSPIQPMNLPDDLYSRILSALRPEESPATPEGALEGGAATAGGRDGTGGQRRALRRRVNHPVRFVRHGASTAVPQEATLLDVSPVGVCILCDSVAAPGEALVVYLPCATGAGAAPANHLARAIPQTVALPCAVRSCRIRSNGMFRVLAEFTDPA